MIPPPSAPRWGKARCRSARPSFLVILLLLGALPSSLFGEGKALLHEKRYRLGRATTPIAGEDRTGPYTLPHAPLVEQSEVVLSHGERLEREKAYWIRYDRGEITFREPLVAGDTVIVRYGYVPLALPLEVYLHKLRFAEGEEAAVVTPGRAPPMSGPLDTGELRVGGSKSFSVLVGSNRDLTLEQALRVTIAGNLAPDIRVSAHLTDQNLPFQPEGRSERLEELDQVLVRIESPHFDATLGDYAVRYGGVEFGRYERELKGASGTWKDERFVWEVSGGLSKGEYESVEIRGVEGKQGPYALLEVSTLGRVVVAGSERVWLDGEKLVRGDENDYVIDYAEGTIIFNPNRTISTESRIAVDFQSSGDRYRRTFVTSRLRTGTEEGRWRAAATFLSEEDDEGEPEALVLSDAEYDSLRASGDRSPLGSSARYDEEGGDYDTTGGVFVFAGRDSGDFDVSFREVPKGEGSYADSISAAWGRRIFVYVGEGKGDHEPFVPIPLPSAHRLFALSGGAEVTGALRLDGEIAWSDLDRNVLSSIDDGENGGRGAKLSAALDETPLDPGGRDLGTLEASASYRSVTDHFEPLGRYRDPHRDERWMTADLRKAIGPGRREEDRLGSGDAFAALGGEGMATGTARWRRASPLGRIVLSGEGGSLALPDFGADRWSWDGALERGRRYRLSAGEERITSTEGDSLTGETEEERGGASIRYASIEPSIGVRRTERRFRRATRLFQGTRERENRFGVTLGGEGSVEMGGRVVFERSDYVDSAASAWARWFDGRTDEASIRFRGPVDVDASYTHRTLAYGETVSEGNRRSDLGRVELGHGGLGGMVRGSWSYEVTTEERRPRNRLLLRAPEGEEADYDSLGNLFPHEGDFHLVLAEGEPEPVVDLELGSTIRIEPARRRGVESGRFWGGFRSETFVRVEELSRTRDPTRLLLLDPTAFQRNDVTVRGRTVVRQELRWADPESEGALRFRYQREDREENEYEGLFRDDRIDALLVRGKIPLGRRLTGEIEWNRRLEREDSNGEEAVDLAGDDVEASLLIHPVPRWRVRIPAALQTEREAVRGERVASIRVEPEGAVHLAAESRLDGRLSYTRFLREEFDRAGSFLRDRRQGFRWRLQLVYEWNRVLSSTVAYSGENLEGKRAEQQFRAEMRAYF